MSYNARENKISAHDYRASSTMNFWVVYSAPFELLAFSHYLCLKFFSYIDEVEFNLHLQEQREPR